MCIAYCEAMDCDNEDTDADEIACLSVEENWVKKTGRSYLPCDLVGACLDQDDDGWGAAGTNQSGCRNTGDDCNDALGNTDDTDRDNVCAVFDNCPSVFNPEQVDADNDGVGDLCDSCIDADADLYGAIGSTDLSLCVAVEQGLPRADEADCDDSSSYANPGNETETNCDDGVDNDCDGLADDLDVEDCYAPQECDPIFERESCSGECLPYEDAPESDQICDVRFNCERYDYDLWDCAPP